MNGTSASTEKLPLAKRFCRATAAGMFDAPADYKLAEFEIVLVVSG